MKKTEKLFFILLAYLPFQIALNVGDEIDLASGRVLILILFLFFLFEASKNSKKVFGFDYGGILLCGFFTLSAISLLQAKTPEWGMRKLLFFASIFPVYFIAKYLLTSSNVNRLKIVKILAACGAAISALGIIQFAAQFIFNIDAIISFQSKYIAPLFYGQSFGQAVVSNPSWLVNISGATFLRAFSIFPDPHNFSLYLGMILPFSLFLIADKNAKSEEKLNNKNQNAKLKTKTPNLAGHIRFFYFPAILIAIFLSFSRSAYAALVLSSVVSLAIFFKQHGKNLVQNFSLKNKRALKLLNAILIFGILLIIFTPVRQRFISSFDIWEGSNLGRLQMWRLGIEVFFKNPFFGVGIGNFATEANYFSEYRAAINAHNTYLEIASETGIFNVIIWLMLIFGSALKIIIKTKIMDFNKRKQEILIYYCSFFGILYFAAQSFFEVSIYSQTNLPMLLVILAIANKNT